MKYSCIFVESKIQFYMNSKLFIKGVSAIFLALTFASCSDDSSEPVIEEPDAIIVSQVTPNSFSATISGLFSGISKVDLALGKSGILYCESSADVESLFKSWKEGNDNSGCQIFTGGKNVSDSYSGILTGLFPETEYSFCLFSQGRDNSAREISVIQKFRTVAFNPEFSKVRIDNVHYFDAIASGSVKMKSEDLASCTAGFIVSKTENGSVDNSILFSFDGADLSNVRIQMEGLADNTEYHCRLFVKYPTASGEYDYRFSTENKFTTRNLMNTAVDLGLPSGIRWAGFDMGEYEFASQFESSPLYYWGSDKPMVYYITSSGRYEITSVDNEHYDKETGTYADLGRQISGTEYDPVHRKYGGKWRLPTKADMEELIENCKVGPQKEIIKDNAIYVPDYDVYISDYINYYELKGSNGNIVKFRLYDDLWSGTMIDEDYDFGDAFRNEYYKDAIYCLDIGYSQEIAVRYAPRGSRMSIRPVWDPNMPDQ